MGSSNKLVPPGATIRAYEMPTLGQGQRPTYQSIKKTFREDASNTRDARFLLSEMVQGQLSVEAEEEKRFKERVAKEVKALREEIVDSAYREGLVKGQTEGRELALAQEKARLATLVEGLSHAIGLMGDAKLKLADDYEARLVALAFRMASVVVDHQIKHQPEIVTESIRAILEKIGQEEDIRIRLSSDDHAIVEQIESELKSHAHKGRITLDLDSSLKRGDCSVEAASGEIASFIEDKLEAVRLELEKIYPRIDLNRKTGT